MYRCVLRRRNFRKKIDLLEEYQGVFNQVYFIFNYPIDDETRELLAAKGYGFIRYYEKHGSFLVMMPADVLETTKLGRVILFCLRMSYLKICGFERMK